MYLNRFFRLCRSEFRSAPTSLVLKIVWRSSLLVCWRCVKHNFLLFLQDKIFERLSKFCLPNFVNLSLYIFYQLDRFDVFQINFIVTIQIELLWPFKMRFLMQMTVELFRLCYFWQETFPLASGMNLNVSLIRSRFRHDPSNGLFREKIFLDFLISVVALNYLLIKRTQFWLVKSVSSCICNSNNAWTNVFVVLSKAFTYYFLKHNRVIATRLNLQERVFTNLSVYAVHFRVCLF